MTIKVLLADDSELVRRAIADLLKIDPEIELIAECASFAQTMEIAAKLHPHVIVLDVHMRDERAATPAQIKSSLNGSRLLAISIWKDEETRVLAESIGAVALLDKTKLAYELIPAIRQYGNGGSEPVTQNG
jgi:two-component system response regulator DesR